MKHFKTPEWDGNKIGDEASKAFASAGKSAKRSPKKRQCKQPENKVSPASKIIKKKSPAKKRQVRMTKVKSKDVEKVQGMKSSPKKKDHSKVKKVLNFPSPKGQTGAKALKSSPKSPKRQKMIKKSNKVDMAQENGDDKQVPKNAGPKPKVQKRKTSEDSAIPAKVKKLQSPEKVTKAQKVVPTRGKKTLQTREGSPKKEALPMKSPSPTKTAQLKSKIPKTSPAKQKPPKKSPLKAKSPSKPTVEQKSTKQTRAKQTSTEVIPSKLKSPRPLASSSIATKKAAKKKVKTKIKIAGLLARRIPAANGTPSAPSSKQKLKKHDKLIKALSENSKVKVVKKSRASVAAATPLRVKMMNRLQSARFRYINEELYTKDSAGAVQLFNQDPEAFTAYHQGYRQQVQKWPMNPLTKIIQDIKKMPENITIADFGCGDAKLAKSVKQQVHSFDLVAVNETVTACDMAKVPLQKHSVDVAVFSLSLMGTNLQDYILEANRVLKVGGTLMIAEVESRFDNVLAFITALSRYGFANVHKDFEHNLFYFMNFRKERDVKNKKNLPGLSLNPCTYKRR